MDLIIASNNEHKILEIKDIFKNFKISIFSLKDKKIFIEIAEDSKTIEGNSLKKANEIYKYLKSQNQNNFLILSDDSGLMIDYLNGAPGVMSARFSGENSTDDKNIQKVLNLLNSVEFKKRNAKFLTVLTLIDEFGNTNQFSGELYGRILNERRGENGFGYDSIFFLEDYNKTLAELNSSEKNSISHRRKAIDKLLNYLKEEYKIL